MASPSGTLPRPVSALGNDTLSATCEGMLSSESLPLNTGPGQAPPGWEPHNHLTSTIYTSVYDCPHFAIGPFERHVRLLFDAHGQEDPPEKCSTGTFTLMAYLNAILVNDADVARWLREVGHLPATYADMSSTNSSSLPGLRQQQWTWAVANHTSEIHLNVTGQDQSPLQHTFRYAYVRNSTVTLVDLTDSFKIANGDPPVEEGHLAPPMLGAQVAGGTWIGQGEELYHDSMEGQIRHFATPTCD